MLDLAERCKRQNIEAIYPSLRILIFMTENNEKYKIRIILKNSTFFIDFDEIKAENIYSSFTYIFMSLCHRCDRFPNLNNR